MSSIERSAYTVALEIGSADTIVRSTLFPATGDDLNGYKQRVWRDIMRSLSEASVTGRIYQLVVRPDGAPLGERLGKSDTTPRRLRLRSGRAEQAGRGAACGRG